MNEASEVARLLAIMARLRDPERGCPWDLRQTFASIAPCTVEEAYEVADAIERNDLAELRDELGDRLLQVVFHSQMAREQNAFSWSEVVAAICDKLIRRHPHVFSGVPVPAGGDTHHAWEAAKDAERAGRGAGATVDKTKAKARAQVVLAAFKQKLPPDMNFENAPLDEVNKRLSEALKMNVQLGCKDPGVQTLTMDFSNRTLQEALKSLGEQEVRPNAAWRLTIGPQAGDTQTPSIAIMVGPNTVKKSVTKR